jgi:hypothetical protein
MLGFKILNLTFWTASKALKQKETIGIILAKAAAQYPMVTAQNFFNATFFYNNANFVELYGIGSIPGLLY